jgi:hypothetical protein
VALALLSLGLVVVQAVPAAALPAEPGAVTGINRELSSLRSRNPVLAANNFQVDISGGPQITPDGIGGFQFFRGALDIGAIYSVKACSDDRHRPIYCQGDIVYGDILASWAANGYETRLGYPQSQESTRTTYCPPGDREQPFKNWQTLARNIACWNPQAGVRWYRVAGS